MSSTLKNRSVDQHSIMRILVSIGLFIFTIFAAFYTIKTGNRLFMVALIALPFAIMLTSRVDILYVFMLLLAATGIDLPTQAKIPMSWLLMLLMLVALTLNLFVNNRDNKNSAVKGSNYLKLFLFIIILLMIVRGTGLRLLGSETWGGTPYLILLTSIGFYCLGANTIRINEKQIKYIVYGGVICGLLGAGFLFAGPRTIYTEYQMSSGVARLSWLWPFILALFPLVFIINKRLIRVLIFLLCLSLVLLTGFRSRFVMLLMIALGYGFFKSQTKIFYLMKILFIGIFLWILIIFISPSLPPTMQRAVSFVPFTQIDYRVIMNAAHSVDWRVEIWDFALQDLSRYWLVGRGVAFNVLEAIQSLGLAVGSGDSFQAYHTHTYHSGPITLLIDFGIPGLLIFLGFTIFLIKIIYRIATDVAKESTLASKYILYLSVSFFFQAVSFWLIFGDVGWLSELIMMAATIFILNGSLRDSDIHLKVKSKKNYLIKNLSTN